MFDEFEDSHMGDLTLTIFVQYGHFYAKDENGEIYNMTYDTSSEDIHEGLLVIAKNCQFCCYYDDGIHIHADHLEIINPSPDQSGHQFKLKF
jgi:hypothetical protein